MEMQGHRALLAGLVTLLFGCFVLWEGSGYSLGTLRRIGPGFFPVALGAVLVVTGGLIALQALASDERIPPLKLRACLFVTAALLTFGLLVDRIGFIASAVLLVVIASMATPRPSVRGVAGLAIVVVPACYAVFVWLLGIPVDAVVWKF